MESMFEDLKRRGLYGVILIISDGHKGIKKAIETDPKRHNLYMDRQSVYNAECET